MSRCTSLAGITFTSPVKKSHILLDYAIVKFMTTFQWKKATEILSLDDKIACLKQAKEDKKMVEIVYLKAGDVKSKRIIKPQRIGPAIYAGKEYMALEAYCTLRKDDRVFNVAKILEIRIIEK